MKRILAAVLAFLFLHGWSCTSSKSIEGEYICTKHFSESMVNKLEMHFSKDGTVMLQPLKSKGTYEVRGDSVFVDAQFEIGFKIEGDKLIASSGSTVYEKK